ncbi:uncharacterized protein KGF55_005296 [Candida pseudojiufengensis]|uniref:uncharacterized protein n=1 Tax=Candida pseudojiufengensis TaxID=497109 RepID=UPI002225B583|nr:uncharacterized protein KGF55_005296 [Candida pseudojiufengensis]KAI5959468.1 hypothetical protein KGF55_005296 [Candida pseudojiufengensis]
MSNDPFNDLSEEEEDDLFGDNHNFHNNTATANPFLSTNNLTYNPPSFGSTNPPFNNLNHKYSLTTTSSSNSSNSKKSSSLNTLTKNIYQESDSDDEFYKDYDNQYNFPKRTKTVTFGENDSSHEYNEKLSYPPIIYNSNLKNNNDFYEFDYENSNSSSITDKLYNHSNTGNNKFFTGDDYMINPLEDANYEGDDDDFLDENNDNDEDDLFSLGEIDPNEDPDLFRKATILSKKKSIKFNNGSLRRSGGTIKKTKSRGSTITFDDDLINLKNLKYTKTIKKAKLINGNYIIDAPIPKALLDTFGKNINDLDTSREMKFMRYTAATCGPSNYIKFNYNLRQELYKPTRQTEIMVCITMYNEDEILLAKTLKGVFENIKDLQNRSNLKWGENSWKKIVVCIISDGRLQLNKRTEILLSTFGIFQDGYAKSKINDKSVKAHIYEYTSTVGIDTINDHVHLSTNSMPVQFIFCLKETNSKKINSHRWCFQAFAPILNPKIIMLLDVGTKPAKDAFYHLWKNFQDPTVAGACGEMKVSLGENKKLLMNPLVAAQNFEYKISNILDKPMESVFGFISVLPGAFSAYRYEALLNVNGKGPLEKYFKGEYLHSITSNEDEDSDSDDEKEIKERNFKDSGIFTSNMYLAEDRILCFELIAKKNNNYKLRYVKEAKAETDVPESIDEFILQRRRWLNGSLFAATYAIVHWTKIWKSNHSLGRKLFLQFEFYYQLITILVSWFSLSSFFLVFRILTANLGAVDMNFAIGKILAIIFLWFYIGCIVCTFVLSFGNTPRGTKKFYLIISYIFAIMMIYMLFSAIFLAIHTINSILDAHKSDFKIIMIFQNSKFRDLVISMLSTYLLYFIGSLLYGEPSFMFTSFIQYILLSPTYINVLNIYSICNIHDVSWGTKGNENAKNLGNIKTIGNNKDKILMIAPEINEITNENYLNKINYLKTTLASQEKKPIINHKLKDDSYYAFIRTITVLIWMLTNSILILIVLENGGINILTNHITINKDGSIIANSEIFLTIILWIVAGLAIFRFFGCLIYLIGNGFRPLKWKIKNRKNKKKQLQKNLNKEVEV